MNNKIFILLFSLGALSCGEDNNVYRNPYLVTPVVNVQINLSLPQFNNLQYAGNTALISNYGINGIILINTGTEIIAYDATCTNHSLKGCSQLELKGVEATCHCEHQLKYNLYIGHSTHSKYPLLRYNVYKNGNTLYITN